ncbi:MAG: zinc ribbon domain-containing protein [Blautia sp.]|nr:zinc ribbon domain-containing protein [Blautia sp.]
MYCAQCGGEIAAGDQFCGLCGAPVAASGVPAENGETLGADRKGKQRGKAGGRKKLVLFASLAVAICLISAAAGVLIWKNGRAVEFEDFLVERCVREELGKDWDERVTSAELASIKELTISWEKDVTVSLDLVTYNLAYSGYVNLEDLRYLTGLETLNLDFDQKSDVFEHLEAIADCKNLKSLSMPLMMQGMNYSNGYMGRGYKYFSELFAQLPELREVDFGVTIPGELQDLLQPTDSHREIEFAEGMDFSEYITRNEVAYLRREIDITTDFKRGIEDAVICVGEGETFDCEDLLDYKDLKTLVIFCPQFSLLKGTSAQVDNLEALAGLPCLCSLSLGNVKVNLAGVEEFPCLRELYLTACDLKKASSLQALSSLRELSIVAADIGSSTLSDLWGHLPKLRYFCGYLRMEGSAINRALGNIKEAGALETLAILNFGNYIDLADALEGLELKNLWLDFMDMSQAIDLDDLEQADSLETLFCRSVESLDGFIEKHPSLVSVTIGSFSHTDDADEVLKYYNDAIRAASKNEKMSMLTVSQILMGLSATGSTFMRDIDLERLYESGIYDDMVQLRAFMQDMDVQTYYREVFAPESR